MLNHATSGPDAAVATMLTRLKALHTFFGWKCTFSWADASCRTVAVHRAREGIWVREATYYVELRPDGTEPAAEVACAPHFVMTSESIPDVVADNLARLIAAQKIRPDNRVLLYIYDLLPKNAVMSFGILARRLEMAGFPAEHVRRTLLAQMGSGHMKTDLRKPIDGASILSWGTAPPDDGAEPPWAPNVLGL